MKQLVVAVHAKIAVVGLLLLCSCATENPGRPQLPAESSMNPSAGRVYGDDVADQLFVKLHLENGPDLIFAVDTGSPFTVLDKSLEGKLGEPIGTRRLNYASFPNVTVNKYRPPNLYLGNTALQLGGYVVVDHIARLIPNRPVAGILGMDSLGHYCLQLDFTTRSIRFLNPDTSQTMPLGRPFPLVRINSKLSTYMEFNGKNTCFLVDTGWSLDGALEPKLQGEAMKVQKPVKAMKVLTSAGTVEQWSCFPATSLGGATFTNMLMQQSAGKVKGNIIGLRFLARNLVTLDFPNQKMYLHQTSVGPLIADRKQENSTP